MQQLKEHLSRKLDKEVNTIHFFAKGQIGDIYKIDTSESSYILKTSEPSDRLITEAKMLQDINKYDIPVPKVYAAAETYLLLEYIEEKRLEKEIQERTAARVLADLHSVTNESRMYGYYYDTTIGPFRQNNEQTQYNWGLFLGQMRIMPMAAVCYDRGQLDRQTMERLERLSRDIYKRIDMSTIMPSLLHGDLWSGNILFNIKGAVLIDPALYFGDREMELAFILMFNTFGETFFNAYTDVHPLSDDFYDTKVPLYQIYPTLVHIALYGGAYTGQLENLLQRLKV
jgi:fructosamine-3-kinase